MVTTSLPGSHHVDTVQLGDYLYRSFAVYQYFQASGCFQIFQQKGCFFIHKLVVTRQTILYAKHEEERVVNLEMVLVLQVLCVYISINTV